MSKFIGRQIQAGIGKESARGTAVAPTFWLQNMNVDVEDKFEGVVDENTIGVIEGEQDFKVTKKFAEGEIGGKVNDKSFGLILLATLGTAGTAAGGEASTYVHTFSVQQDAQHDSLTLEIKNPNEQKAHANAVITKLGIKAALGKLVEFTAGFMGKLGVAKSNSPSYSTTENSFIAKDVTLKLATNIAGLGAASAISVKDIEINIEKNVESDDILGSFEPADFLNKQLSVSGSVELVYDATTYKALALAGTSRAMRITIENTDAIIGTTLNPKMVIDLAKVKFTEWARTSDQNEIITQTLSFQAYYSAADSSMISVVLTNAQASY
jgi:hypothetical protein